MRAGRGVALRETGQICLKLCVRFWSYLKPLIIFKFIQIGIYFLLKNISHLCVRQNTEKMDPHIKDFLTVENADSRHPECRVNLELILMC